MDASPDNENGLAVSAANTGETEGAAVPAPGRRLPAKPEHPYAGFADGDFMAGDFEKIPPLQALLEDGEIAGYLKRGAPATSRAGSPLFRAFIGLVCAAAVLFAFSLFPGWVIFRRYAPPPLSETWRPAEFDGDIPLQFGDAIRDLRDAIRSGNKWTAVFDKFRDLLAEMDASPLVAPPAVRVWARTETLVSMASGEISPERYPPAFPDEIFAGMLSPEGQPAGRPPPYRAERAYAVILHAALVDAPADRAGEENLLALLDRIRGDYADVMDRDRELLAIEAEHHIRMFPPEYRENDRLLAYHWRRAAHAIQGLYALPGAGDMRRASLDRKRWLAVAHYFDFTLLTLEWNRIGRIGKITLDGKDYAREDVLAIIRDIR